MSLTRFDQENQDIQRKMLRAQETIAAELTKLRTIVEHLAYMMYPSLAPVPETVPSDTTDEGDPFAI